MAGRRRLCAIDAGSRNVKLVVASMQGEDALSLLDERVCRSRLELGEKTFDQAAKVGLPLRAQGQQALGELLADYAAVCTRDGGDMIGVIATEWARRATNRAEIEGTVKARSRLDLEVISPELEGHFGYMAATRGKRGKLVLDFGSRSVQLSYWPSTDEAPHTTSLPLGINEAGDRFFDKRGHLRYRSARRAFVAAFRKGFTGDMALVRAAIRAGTLSPELFSLGENGDVALALEHKLWVAGEHRGVDEEAYVAALKEYPLGTSPTHGVVSGECSVHDLARLAQSIDDDRDLYKELRSDRIKGVYGNKMLSFPAVIVVLAEDVGIERVVMISREMADGLIFERSSARARDRDLARAAVPCSADGQNASSCQKHPAAPVTNQDSVRHE